MFNLFRENTKIALDSIKTQLLRTILTVFIISLGIFALVGILAAVAALENTIMGNFASMGSNAFTISRYDNSEQIGRQNDGDVRENPIISYPQAKEFQDKYSYGGVTTSLSFTAAGNVEVKYEGKKSDPDITIIGADQNYLPNSGLETPQGRNFTPFDVNNNNYVCIVGSDFAKGGLLKDAPNPIGKVISIRGARFTVVGVLKERGSTFGNRQDLNVIIPIQLARSLFTAPNIDYTIKVNVANHNLLESSVDEAILTMRRVRHLNPVQGNNFGIERSDELLAQLKEETAVMNAIAWAIGVITVFGSSIALMNIMLVSVTERTREIGVRKSLGATRLIIALQFLTETLVICIMGAAIGVLLGLLVGFGFSMAMGLSFAMPWQALFAALSTVVIVTIFSGLYPAVKAAALDPVEALRYE
ncbi:ABC transporter permease [Flavobacterium akiainvivens]|uniref:ABC transporter permease n=1 Tax=Flavobacterium akiainvivens TaxID=1202724 RepID=A0A0M8MAQ9_9FLAO|nr:ABC transporter permease [Flavobacterium akiainvivens]KOS06145.1 ABC transporter permease [Flavobacterium akiainvivens]SFQ67905.1 putative ABC transport system permease protein [Flavobacterium akiainvivens]